MALLRTAGAWGSSEVHSGRGSGVLLRTTSEVAALQQIKEQLEAQSRPAVRSHLGVQLHQEWWLIGGATPAALEQQQQDEAIDSSPINRLVRARRLQPASLRVYDFEQHAWVQQHALTRFPPELPVSRWAVASLLNKMKKKESSIFLVRPCPFLGASQHWAEQCQEPACPAS
ncbi:hypothetical protein COHA_006761 [Chlorella ohadii]|uniref:Uncharacterized protein n=1 Tax=Chlorella ohadii TaxID=2649997 RepID=A0AAD5H0J0_9CHLO|nr:hypothetical protein COHA_006761 [Chlorella ohadii]